MKVTAPSPADTPESLAAQVVALQARVAEQARELAEKQQRLDARDQRIDQLLDYIQLLRQKRFGGSADRVSKDQIALALFDESELEQLIGELEAQLEVEQSPVKTQGTPSRKQPARRPLPAHLRRVDKIIDLSEEEKAALGDDWVLIGYEESEQLATIARQYYVVRTRRAKYAPRHDEVAGAERGLRVAPRPETIIPKSLGHSSLIADVVTSKFVDGLPLYRQEAIFNREGIDLSRQTMSGWITQLETPLAPLMAQMKQLFYAGRLIQIDETRLQVLNEPGRDNTQQSFMWVYRGGPPDTPVVWYQYAETRSGEVPLAFLLPPDESPPPDDWAAYLQTDGYSGYNALARQPHMLGHAACWAHVRRKFVEATQGRKNTAAAHQMVALIGKLYRIERTIKGSTPEVRQAVRQEKARPVLEQIKVWLDQKAPQTLPKSLLGKAIHYTLGLWPELNTYLEDGHIEIDNNRCENAIRPFVIGRKGFLFSGSPRGARASAMLYTLIETAKANGLEPRGYLNHVFEHLPTARTEQAIRALLPQFLKADDLAG
jgi:transposase